MKNRKVFIIIIATIIITIICLMIYKNRKEKFNINTQISEYKLSDPIVKDNYIDYLKQFIKVEKLNKFIKNDYVALSPMSETSIGKDVIKAMEFVGYKELFMSMFDKERINFDDCPVTKNFKEKFNTNLIDYFGLKISDDCESDCLLNIDNKEIMVEVYGNFKNTEPTCGKTHHFHYTLDDDGNVDDVIFDYTEK